MNLINKCELVEKKSKFIGLLYEVNSIEELNILFDELKKEYKKHTHFTYAYIIGNKQYKSDDKEPKNTAGLPILNVLKRKNLNNHVLIVIRYFGGTKLGASLLLRTYSKTANMCLSDF